MEINAKAKKPVRPRVTAKQKKKEAVEKEQNAVEEQPSAKVVTPTLNLWSSLKFGEIKR